MSWVFCRARAVSCLSSLTVGSSRVVSSSFQLKPVSAWAMNTEGSTPVAIRSKSATLSESCWSSCFSSSSRVVFSASEVLALSCLLVTEISWRMFFCNSTSEASMTSVSDEEAGRGRAASCWVNRLMSTDSMRTGSSLAGSGGCTPARRGGKAVASSVAAGAKRLRQKEEDGSAAGAVAGAARSGGAWGFGGPAAGSLFRRSLPARPLFFAARGVVCGAVTCGRGASAGARAGCSGARGGAAAAAGRGGWTRTMLTQAGVCAGAAAWVGAASRAGGAVAASAGATARVAKSTQHNKRSR